MPDDMGLAARVARALVATRPEARAFVVEELRRGSVAALELVGDLPGFREQDRLPSSDAEGWEPASAFVQRLQAGQVE